MDSGCTGHYLLINAPCRKKIKSEKPLRVRLPNGDVMSSSHTAYLTIPELSDAASIAHIFPQMANNSLLSVGQLCDEGYHVTFRQASVAIFNSTNKAILHGSRDHGTGLWRINLRDAEKKPEICEANNVYELRNTGALVNYLHKALFSPTKSAMLEAVKRGHLVTWPGLTEEAINKHLKLTPATAMGHMNQQRQNTRSTKTVTKAELEEDSAPKQEAGTKTHMVYAAVIDQGQLYTDLTGRFPVRSSKGNWYVMIVYSYDCNYIKPVAMKSKTATEWVKVFGDIFQELTSKGFKPKLQTMDNEASAALKKFHGKRYRLSVGAATLSPEKCSRARN